MTRSAEQGVALVPLSLLSAVEEAAKAPGAPKNMFKAKDHGIEDAGADSQAALTIAF